MRTLGALLPGLLLALIPASAQTITTSSPLPNGVLNQSYTTQLACTNCKGLNFVLVSGNLPAGYQLSPSGIISGITSVAGTSTFQIGLLPPAGGVTAGTKTFTLTIPSGLTILTTGFPTGAVGATYSQPISASGGVPPYTWSITQGSLPPGLGIQNNNAIGGTPTAVGTYNFTLTVYDSQQNGAFLQTSITINTTSSAGATITTTTLPNGVVNVAYSGQLACNNCTGWTWSLSSGLLPLGLSLSAGGAITGTPSTAGTNSFQITLSPPQSQINTESGGPSPVSQIFNITVNGLGLSITQTTLPIGFTVTPYSTTLTGSGGLTPYTWSLTSTANDGLTIGASTGILSGTPAASGTYLLAVQIADSSGLTASKQFTLTVSTGLSILTTSLPNGSVGTIYPTQTLTAGGGQPPYRWAVTTGSLPPGLALDPVFGRISGTPTANGKSTFTLTVTDNQSNTATATLSITVGAGITITISPATLTGASVGTAYSQAFSATGGTAPYTWTTASGTLPAGLTLSAAGTLSGTPTTAGTYNFTVQATDVNQATGQAALSLVVNSAPVITITPATLTAATVGTSYTQPLAATGGTAPYKFTVTAGSLPSGLSLSSAGAFSGTASAAGSSTFTVTATDANGATGTIQYTLRVNAPTVTIIITPATLPAVTVGASYTQALAASGGTAPYKFAVTAGSLPSGLSLSSAGAFSGTASAAGSSTFTVTATDANGATGTIQYTLTVSAPTITVTPATLPAATAGASYTQALAATGGAAPYKFAVTTGSLPSGLSLSSAGAFSGTASAAGSSTFTVTATDANGATGTIQYTLTVSAPTITVTPATLPAATAGASYTQALAATGGAAPYKFAVTTGSLPSGLSLSSAGAFSGTASAAGSSTFTVTATDANGATGTIKYTLAVNAPSAPSFTLTGVPATSGFQQQLGATPTISSAYPSAITGTVVLTFTPSVTPPSGSTGTIDDAMIQFSGGGRSTTFTIPAGSTTSGSNLTVLTGTTAGTITLTTTLTAGGTALGSPVTQTIVNKPGVPFISKVTLQQVSGGVSVVVTGFSSTRDMINGQFTFAPAANDTFTSNNVSVPLQNAFTTWWSNTAQSNPYGTEFTLTVPFTLATATQSVSSVVAVSVTVTLQNSVGASNPVTLSQ